MKKLVIALSVLIGAAALADWNSSAWYARDGLWRPTWVCPELPQGNFEDRIEHDRAILEKARKEKTLSSVEPTKWDQFWMTDCSRDSARLICVTYYGCRASVDEGFTMLIGNFVDSVKIDTITLYQKYWFLPMDSLRVNWR